MVARLPKIGESYKCSFYVLNVAFLESAEKVLQHWNTNRNVARVLLFKGSASGLPKFYHLFGL